MKKAGLFIFLFLVSLLLFSQEESVLLPTEPAAETAAADDAAAAENTAEPGVAAETAAATSADAAAAGDAEGNVAALDAEETPEEKERTLEDKGMDPASVLERDINTATAEELADWCRSLGLSGDGGKEALATRLREYHKLGPGPASQTITVEGEGEKQPLIITIEYAKTTEYFTVTAVDEEYVRLRGGVSVTIKDGDNLHKIQAEEILYNRTKEMMTASGGVVYVKSDAQQGAGEETTFRGAGITVNLNNWSTAFMEGVSDRKVGDGTLYRFSGEVISRSGDDSIVLRKAKITNPEQEEPYWSIDATRLWLLPGNDFAILNAVIKVGEIPILWFPAFFYPGSEVIFRPVLGVRSREGTFVQTTTFILGRPKITGTTSTSSEEPSTFSTFMGSNEGMETKREGIFLRSTGRKAVNKDEPNMYLMADAYSNLGYFVGSELLLPPKNRFGQMSFSLGLGVSRDIIQGWGVNGYTPFNYDGTDNWHYSRFFGNEISFPLRYRFASTGSVSASGTIARSANLSWNLPLYSDPYIDNDFITKRSMDSNIFDLLKTYNKIDNNGTTDNTYLTGYNWTLNGSLSFATTALNPYVSSLSISSASMSVNFDTKPTVLTVPPIGNLSMPPNQRFFHPSKFTLFNVNASIGGTPLSLGSGTNTRKRTEREETEIIWGEPFSPWYEGETEEDENSEDLLALHPPTFSRTMSSAVLGERRFTLVYQLTPSVSSEAKFNSTGWNDQVDVDWSDWEDQLFTYRVDGSVTLSLTGKQNLYSHSLSVSGTKSGQEYLYMNEDLPKYATPENRERAENAIKPMTYFRSNGRYTFTLNPFVQSNVWKSTNLQYNLQGLVYKKEYLTVSGGVEEKEEKFEWTQEKITTNSFQANVRANVMEKQQSFTVTADLPPKKYDEEKVNRNNRKVPTVRGNLGLAAWISQTNVSSGVEDPFEDPFYNAIDISETFRFPKNVTLTHTMTYIPENQESERKPNPEKPGFRTMTTTLNSSQSWGTLSASFRAQRARPYYLDATPGQTGWKLKPAGEEEFTPQSLSFRFTPGNLTIKKWTNVEAGVNMNTDLAFDLMRYTNSNFNFSLSGNIKINKFLDFTITSNSYNKAIYRYFRNMPFFDPVDVEIAGEKNLFVDLFNSFRFDDIEKRRASGFKLSSLDLKLTHYLGDWDAILSINVFPELDKTTQPYVYVFKSTIGFLVKWTPIREFKTDIRYTTDDGLTLE